MHILQHILSFPSAGKLAIEAETAPQGGNDYSIRECAIIFPFLCILPSTSWMSCICVSYLSEVKPPHVTTWTRTARFFCYTSNIDISVCRVKMISPDVVVKYQMSWKLLCGCTVEETVSCSPSIKRCSPEEADPAVVGHWYPFVVPLCWTAIDPGISCCSLVSSLLCSVYMPKKRLPHSFLHGKLH